MTLNDVVFSRKLVRRIARDVITNDSHAKRAYDSLRERKLSHVDAIDEISRALLGFLWEALGEKLPTPDSFNANAVKEWMGKDEPRWNEIMRLISEGKKTTEIWPE